MAWTRVRSVAPAGAADRLAIIEGRTAEKMAIAALRLLPQVQGVIASAAVMDYRVARPVSQELKRAGAAIVPAVDVLGALREAPRGQWFLGFAALREVAALSAAETVQMGKSGRRPFKAA